ncbi:MAG: hypothetical protein HKP31_06710 [Nitrosopumilus sp.]|nr:hypothetical protein [Nitrosopumilus sp.]
MGTSFLLLLCTIHKNIEVADTIRKLPGVKEAIPVTGVYDCIVKTGNMTSEDVDSLVLTRIRPIDHVRSVITLHEAPSLLVAKNV